MTPVEKLPPLESHNSKDPESAKTRSPRPHLSAQTCFAHEGKTWPAMNRNRCRTPSQSGLNPKYEADNSREYARNRMFTESLALSKRRLLNGGCHLTLLWRRNFDSINCGVLRRRTKKTGSLQIRMQESRTGPVKSRRTGSSPQPTRWGWAGSAGVPSGTIIPLYYMRSV